MLTDAGTYDRIFCIFNRNPAKMAGLRREEEEMAEKGYCVKCKAMKEIKDAEKVTMKNKRLAVKGKCPDCGTGMYRILGKSK
jgi:hypothetical protein